MDVYKSHGGLEIFIALTAENNYRAFTRSVGSPPRVFSNLKPYPTRTQAEKNLNYYCARLHKGTYEKVAL